MQENYNHVMKLSNETKLFLLFHTIAPTPINYSVIYLYLSKENKQLTESISHQISANKSLTSDFLQQLFDDFISNTQRIENNLLSPLEETLSTTLKNIDGQISNEQEVLSNLDKITLGLKKSGQYQPLQNIVNFLLKAIGQSQEQRYFLTNELQKASEEVNQLQNKLEESRQEALIDALTGLYNRRGCEKKLQELSISDTHSSLVVDIDHFKQVNDNFGHHIGDRVIQRVAKVIQKSVSDNDISVRYGGEEFVVILSNKSIDIAEMIAEKIRFNIERLQLVQRKTQTTLPPITVSIGIAQSNNDKNWTTLFDRADQALYQAKNSGRNCYKLAKAAEPTPAII